MAGRVVYPPEAPQTPYPPATLLVSVSSLCVDLRCGVVGLYDAVADDSLYRPGNRKYLPRLPAHHLLHHLLVSLAMGMLLTSRVTGVILIFVEVPLLMRICPTSEKFDSLVRRFNENWPRAGMYVGYAMPLFF